MLKGHTKVELFDAKTGKRTDVMEKDNMVTGTLQNLLSGIGDQHKRAHFADGTTIYTLLNENMPLFSKNFGGITIYDTPLTESANTVIPSGSNKVVASASGEYSGANTWRGTYNTNESGPVYDGSKQIGFRYVFDFGTDKGNGTISALSLTNEYSGRLPTNCPAAERVSAVADNTLFKRETMVLADVLSYSGSLRILRIEGDDIYYADTTSIYKKSVKPPTGIKLLTEYSAYTTPVLIGTYSYSMYAAGIMPNGNIVAVENGTGEFISHVVSVSTWQETQVHTPCSDASSYSSYTKYYDGRYLYLFLGGSTVTIKVLDAVTGELLLNTTKAIGGSYSTSIAAPVFCYGDFVVFAFPYNSDTAGRCVIVNKTDLSVSCSTSGLCWYYYYSRVGYSSYNTYHYYKPISCDDVAKPYILFEEYTYDSNYTKTNRAVKKLLYRDHIHTIQNLTEPVEKTAEKTMKVTYIIQETE